MLPGMTGIQQDNDIRAWSDFVPDPTNRGGVDRVAFYQANKTGKRMRFDRSPVRGPKVNLNSYDPAFADELAEAGIKEKRPAMSHARFNDNIRLQAINDFLDADDVFGQLN